MRSIASRTFFVSALLARYGAANSVSNSEYFTVPGYDVQTLGVGADGVTTYIISRISSMAGIVSFDGPGLGIYLTYMNSAESIEFIENCGITGSIAVCTNLMVMGGSSTSTFTIVATDTLSMSTYPVEGGAPTAMAASTSALTRITTDSTASSSASTTTTAQNKTSDGVKSTLCSLIPTTCWNDDRALWNKAAVTRHPMRRSYTTPNGEARPIGKFKVDAAGLADASLGAEENASPNAKPQEKMPMSSAYLMSRSDIQLLFFLF
ncbi:uncharacterized protein FIBRA_02165 [Fibroporia radiculosa]|uniref:Uncharacterized protein n=1 Tax=Fibroporia radiculosa TaxID=599839 RepID=J4G1E0_9APHY|nr:uncharacterized protein FIBRA_02165 [Fibroporia radiculosa]CCM00138.1 predicted protein [Fibroporia radiculosa]